MSKKTNRLLLCALALVMVSSFIGASLSFNGNSVISAAELSAYVELYTPGRGSQLVSADPNHLALYVEDKENSPTGKALVMDYTPVQKDVDFAIPVESQDAPGFEGLAMWVDIPQTADSYSFAMADATCTAPSTCINGCGHTEGEKIDHTYGDWEIVKIPTHLEEGLQQKTCQCGDVVYETLPINEDYDVKSCNGSLGTSSLGLLFAAISSAVIIRKKRR